MADQTKDDLKRIIKELKAKLTEMKGLEKQVQVTAQELTHIGFSIVKGDKNKYSLVQLKFDIELNAAVIDTVTDLDTTDHAIANFKAMQFLTEKIMRKARGDRYAE